MRSIIFFSWAFLVVFGCTRNTILAESIGYGGRQLSITVAKIEESRFGSPKIYDGQVEKYAEIGMEVLEGNTVSTGQDDSIELRVDSQSTFHLDFLTSIQFHLQEWGNSGQLVVDFEGGYLHIYDNAHSEIKSILIRTKSVLILANNASFSVGGDSSFTHVFVNTGKVLLLPPFLNNTQVEMIANEYPPEELPTLVEDYRAMDIRYGLSQKSNEGEDKILKQIISDYRTSIQNKIEKTHP